MGGGGKSSTSTQTVSIPPEVLARYNAVNARAESVAQQPFQQYTGEFVAPLTPTQQAGIQATSAASQLAQPYYGAATGAALAGAMPVTPQGLQVDRYMNPFTQSVVGATQAAMGQQQGQQLAQQQAESIRAGAFGGDRAGLQRQALRGQQGLAQAQAIAPLYQQGYQQALQTAQQQQGVGLAAEQANRQAVQQLSQQLGGLGTGAQQAALQGAQAQIGAGTLQQQTQQAQDTAQYQQFLQERGYPFQVAQFLANIAMGTGALSGSTTSTTQPRGFFSNRGGFKTGESLQRSGKAYGGGLDPNSMGGAVYEPGAFERGGYATSGAVVDSNDLAAILAQQRQSFGPFAAAGPYGQAAGAAPHGPSGIVPQQQLATPKLVTAGALPKQQSGVGSDLGKMYSLADEATKGLSGRGLTERAGEKFGLRDSPEKIAEAKGDIAPAGVTGKSSGTPLPMARPDASELPSSGGFGDWVSGLFKAEGGGVMPRHRYADGGGEDSQGDEAIPYDPSDVTSGKDPIEGVLKAGSQKPQMLKPASGGGSGGGGSSKLGLGKLAGSALGSTFGPVGSAIGGTLGSLLPFNEGGVVPRQHFQDGGPEDSFERALRTTLGHEGGYTVDTGGPTMKGISSRANPDVDLERVGKDPEYTRGIYRERYWNPIGASEMDPKLAGVAFDAATNHGVGKTKQMLEEAGGDPAKLLQLRQQHYDQLVTSNPEKYGQYARGWNNRLNSFAKELGMEPLAYAGSEGGMGRAAGQQAIQRATSGEGLGAGKPASFIDGIGFNKQTILPLLQGIGAMASSKSISPWAAALQGLGAGAKAYGEEETRQAGTSLTDAQTVNQFMDAARKALMANPANPNVLMVLTPRGWMTQGQAQRLGLPTIGAPLPAAAGATALRRQGSQQLGLGPFDAEKVDITSATTPQAPKVDAISEVIPPSQNKVQPLGMPGAYYDTQARTAAQADAGSSNISAAQSEEVRKDIDRAVREASAGKPIMNDLTQNTAALIANPAAGSGPFANPRKSVLSVADYASRLLLGKELPAEFSPSDLEVNKKIASYLAGQQTSSVNQNSLQAFTTALSAAPNSELSPQALAKITALLMVQKSRAERLGEFARVYGEDAEGRLSANVIRQYDRIHGRQMQEEQNSLADFFVKYPKAAQKVAKGEIPYEVAAQKFKELYGRPDMAYHFQNR